MESQQKIQTIGQKYNLKFVILFGSQARNQRKNEESDLDIAVFSMSIPDVSLFKDLFAELSDIFPHENVDVRFLNGADLLFRFNVVKDGKLLYGDEEDYQRYKLSTIKMYTDDLKKFEPFMNRLLELNQERLEAKL